jgi:hypothetical protein
MTEKIVLRNTGIKVGEKLLAAHESPPGAAYYTGRQSSVTSGTLWKDVPSGCIVLRTQHFKQSAP